MSTRQYNSIHKLQSALAKVLALESSNLSTALSELTTATRFRYETPLATVILLESGVAGVLEQMLPIDASGIESFS